MDKSLTPYDKRTSWIELKDDRSETVRYNSPNYPIYVKEGLLSTYPNYSAAIHWHDDVEFIAVLSGEMDYNINGEIVTMKQGDGIFINSRQIHFGFSKEHRECNFICILLHPSLLGAVPQTEYDFVFPVIRNTAVPYHLLSKNVEWERAVTNWLIQMFEDHTKKTAPLLVQSDFFQLWSLIYEHLSTDDFTQKSEDADLTATKNMVGYIQKNYSEKITLPEIAAAGAVGQSKCCRLFQHYFKQSPILYLNQHRLNKSLELLRDTDYTITEIALTVGFSGGSYFTETFRKWMGKSPSEYRKSI